MFDRLTERAERSAQEAARRRAALAKERIGAVLPGDCEIDLVPEGVRLSGRSLGRRLALDPELRWLGGYLK